MSVIVPSNSEPKRRASPRAALRTVALTLLMTLAFLALGAGYGRYRFGSMSATRAYLRGERLLVDTTNQSTSGEVGGRVQIRYTLTNWTDHQVTILGFASSCTCTIIDGLPLTLAVTESKAVTAMVSLEKAETNVSGLIRLFTDDPRTPEILLAYSVRIEPARPALVR